MEKLRWDTMLITWLVNFMTPTIRKAYFFLPMTKDVWDVIRETYSDDEDSSQIEELMIIIWKV